MPEKKFLLVHGVGYKEADGSWDADWQQAIKQGFAAIAPDVEPTFDKVLRALRGRIKITIRNYS